MLHRLGIDSLPKDAAPGTLVRHLGSLEAEEAREIGCTQFGPVGQGFEAAMAGELGEDGEGQEDRQGVAQPAVLTAIGHRLEVGS